MKKRHRFKVGDLVELLNLQVVRNNRKNIMAKYNLDPKKFSKIKKSLRKGKWRITEK